MYEVLKEHHEEIEVKQSKFLSFLMPVAILDERLEALRIEHPKARHFIVAWRRLNEFQQIQEYSTDDGEPKGTSGRPVLNVLRGFELINTALIIVRYFGGTKLGTGGLVRAYGDAAKTVLSAASLYPFEIKYPLALFVSYAHNKRAEHWLQGASIEIEAMDFEGSGVHYRLKASKEQKEALIAYEKTERIITIS